MLWIAFWLFFVVTAIAVVGHGIWVTVAAVLRALFVLRTPEVKITCELCGHLTGAVRPFCDWCGRQRVASAQSGNRTATGAQRGRVPETVAGVNDAAVGERNDLQAVERQLERWRAVGRMKPTTAERLLARVRAYAASMQPRRAAAAEAGPEIVPAKVVSHAAPELILHKQDAHLASPPLAAAPAPISPQSVVATGRDAPPPAPAPIAPPPPSPPSIAAEAQTPVPPTLPTGPIGAPPPRRPVPAAPRAPAKPSPPPAPPRPRRTLAEVFAAFMEERNIRWGELVGGALIVCSSVALVISLWETLKTIPYIQFFIFIGVSAALFGAGLYTHHRWKLASTSRGILIIATLLVPLNFVAMAGTARESWDLPAAVMQLAALAIFSLLVMLAGHALVAEERGWLTLAVVGNSAVTLLTPHRPALGWAVGLAALPVALTAVAVGRVAWRAARRDRLTADDVHRLFILLGTTMFALAVAAGLIVARSEDRTATLDVLAPLAALAGMPVALCGLLAVHALAREPELAGWRTAGTALALVGGLVMLAALGLAWPLPAALIAVGLLDAAALTLMAVRYRFPAAHVLAIACLAVAYITAVHGLWGDIGLLERASDAALIRIFASGRTGTTLVGLFVALAVAAEAFARNSRRDDASIYLVGCGIVAVMSLSLVAVHGYLEGHANAWRATAVFATYGVGCLGLNVRWRKPLGTHAGAALLGGAIVYALVYAPGAPLPYRWLAVALVQGAWTLVASLLVGRGRAVRAALEAGTSERTGPAEVAGADVFSSPLRHWAKAASLLAVVLFLWSDWRLPLILSGYLIWLAALWLPLAIAERSPRWFAAFQVALYASTGFALTAWLNEQPWVALDPRGLRQPSAWHFYGAALAGVSLVWVVLRAAGPVRFPFARSESENSQSAADIDRWVYYALTAASLALAIWGVSPDVCAELGVAGAIAPPGAHADAFGASAWLLLGVLAVGLVAALWHRWTTAELVSAPLVAINAALLLAGAAADQLASASALRWSLATTFLLGAFIVCGRETLARICARLGCRVEGGRGGTAIVEALLAALAAAPVVLLSATVALMRINGQPPAGPLPGIWLGDVGMSVSHLIPLAMVVTGLVAYAVREASAGYAFAGGLVANLTVCGGYALNVSQFGVLEAARLVQLATIVAASWAVCWLLVRGRVLAWHARSESPAAWPLVRLQLAQSALGNLLLLMPAFGLLALTSPNPFAEAQAWIAAAGGPLGWLALVAALAAEVLAARRLREPLRPEIVGLMGLTVIGLCACSVAAALPDTPWAYRALMLGWASYALSIVAVVWWASAVYFSTTAGGPPAALIHATATWVRLAGSAAVFLGIKTALGGGSPEELSWAAGAIGIASAAGAAMAVWRRQEEWAFAAGLGVNLAASMAVWHRLLIEHRSPSAEWLLLVEANLIAAAGVALLWLAARRRMYAGKDFSLGASPWLATEVSAVAMGNLALAMLALVDLLTWPERATPHLVAWAAPPGWFAWLLGGAAAAIYVYHTARPQLAHVSAAWLIGLGVLAAAGVARSQQAGWPAYHALIVAWSLVGFLLLAAGWLGDRVVEHRQQDQQARPTALDWLIAWIAYRPPEKSDNLCSGIRENSGANPGPRSDFSQSQLRAGAQSGRLPAPAAVSAQWLPVVEFLLAGLAVRAAAGDPLRPWWPSAAALVAGVLAGGLALWRRQQASVYRSGLFVNLAVSLVWFAGANRTIGDLLLANAIALAATAVGWSLLSRVAGFGRNQEPAMAPPFEHSAAIAATGLLTVTAAITWTAACFYGSGPVRGLTLTDARLVWGASAAVIAALAIALADRRARFAPPCFYAAGLATVATALVEFGWVETRLVWASTPALAGWILTAALATALRSGANLARTVDNVGWALPTESLSTDLLHSGGQCPPYDRLLQARSTSLFNPTQAALTAAATALTFWVCLAFDAPRDRLAGAIAAALLLAAAIVMQRGAGDRWRIVWQDAVLSLAVVVPTQFGWALLPGAPPAILAIHRIAVALVSLAAIIALGEFAAPRWLAADGSWRSQVRRFLPVAIGCSLLLLAVALGLERSQFVRHEGVPMALAATVAVAVVLLGLVVLALIYAVWGERDPLRLTPRGRTAYVYAAEVLACLIMFHVRTTVPRLIPYGLLENWWTLVVMAVAFAGAGLAELFERRRLAVLAEPLARTAMWAPLLPALAPLVGRFWHPANIEDWLFEARYVPSEAVCFLVAIFYGLQATLKRSLGWGLLSAAAGNLGLWLLWDRLHFDFLVHPQLWLIPPALAALAAEHINRDRLSSEQGAAVRYLALAIVYVSSTADVFISHVGTDISLPLVLVLMGLSVCGVLAGMLLRVRSFLYLGVTFLLVDLSVMIYHAAWDLDHTWVFWAAGIGVGMAILVLFGLFEKRRNELEHALERFKQWQ